MTICISLCAWVSFYVSHDYLIINKLRVCCLSIISCSVGIMNPKNESTFVAVRLLLLLLLLYFI